MPGDPANKSQKVTLLLWQQMLEHLHVQLTFRPSAQECRVHVIQPDSFANHYTNPGGYPCCRLSMYTCPNMNIYVHVTKQKVGCEVA